MSNPGLYHPPLVTPNNVSENNYLLGIIDAEIHQVMNLGETIKAENNASLQDTVLLPQKDMGWGQTYTLLSPWNN